MKKNHLRLLALVMALVMTAGLLPTAAMAAGAEPTEVPATAPQEKEPVPSESSPAETVPDPKPTESAPTAPEPTETEPAPETTAPTEPMPTEPEVTEPPIPETSAPTEPVMTEPTVPETTVPETTVPETVPATTAPEETTAPTEPPFLSPTPLLENLPADFQSRVQVPDGMQHNLVLDALTELGYPVDRLRDAGVLYDYNYTSIMLPEAYRTGIPYGGGSTGLESVDHFRTNGLVCASFVSYYLWNFLPRNGVNTTMLTENFTGNYASVPEIRGVLEAASQNYAYYDTAKEHELRVIKREVGALADAKPGDLLFYGDTHCAIYLGTADLVDSFTGEVLEPNAVFLAHCGTDRGVEITTNSELEASGLKLTEIFSVQNRENISYFYLPSDGDERAATVVVARMQKFSLGQDVDYKYYVWKGYMHRVGSGRWYINECAYFELANGAIAYCLEPWNGSPSPGSSYEEITDPWNPDGYNSWGDHAAIMGPDARKKQAVMKILSCGAHNRNASEAEKRATALFVWDAICGYWDGNIANQSTSATGQYDDYGASIDNPPFYRSTWGYDNGVKAAYEAISNRIKGGQKYPSFANLSSSNLGAANTFTLVKNPSNGMYEASKTDTNNILGDYNFTISPISGLTISRSGNVLKISATEAAASEVYRRKGVVASATGHYYNFGNLSDKGMTVWGRYWDSSVQKFISMVNFNLTPIPCYIKIDAKVDLAAPVSLKKSMKGDPDIIAQLQGNACYSLAGAEYGVYKGGVWQETLTTNANGDATSVKKYENGTVLTFKELKAPPGFKLDQNTYTITIRSGQANVVYVADEPAFDPRSLTFEKKDPDTGLPSAQGNAAFAGAVFKWEYFDNQNWSGSPTRTWHFETKSDGSPSGGRHGYSSRYLANGYHNDKLYIDKTANGTITNRIPVGSIRITEVKAPYGYSSLPELKANIRMKADGSGAEFVWTPESAKIVESKDGRYDYFQFPEPEDPSTFASISIQKHDSDTGGAAPNGADFAGCEFTVYNRSANPVKIGNFPVAAPGEACYVLTLDAAGRAATGAEFPLGKYEIRETKGNAYYQCNTGWSQTFEVTMGGNTAFSFTVANTPVKAHIQLTKIDSTDGKPLTGAVFTVTHPDGHTENMVEEANGIHALRNLRYGKYTVQETKAPDGFQLDPTVYTVEITENGKVYEVKTPGYEGVANAPVPGSISVQKVDSHGNPMLGVSFKLEYSLDDGKVWKPVTSRAPDALLTPGTSSTPSIVDGALTTDAGGKIRFEGLRINSQTGNVKYRLTEVATTNGHTLLAGTAFEGYITADKVDITIRAINGTAFELPTSGSTELAVVQLIGAAIIVLALIGFSATSFSSKLDQTEEKKKHRK